MEREKSSLFLGLGLLIAGIIVLMFVLASVVSLAASPGPFIERNLGGGQASAPTAAFTWSSNGTTADFRDLTTSGSAAITEWSWDFGDGATASSRDATHTYPSNGTYPVRLTVRDENGLQAVAAGQVDVQNSGGNGGMSQTAPNFNFNGDTILLPIGIAILTGFLWIVGFLVGGSLVKAGWNLIRPRPETIRIRVKPHMLEAAVAGAEAMPPTPGPVPTAAAVPPPPPT